MLAPVALCAGRLAQSWAVSTIQGRREEQEDRFAVVPRIRTPRPAGANADDADEGSGGLAFFAVYDGHGGAHCTRYAAATLHEHFMASRHLAPTGGDGAVDVGRALADAFAKTEEGFLAMAHAQRLSSGTTALAAVLALPSGWSAAGAGGAGAGAHGQLTVAHVGDSRGVLCRGGKAIALTTDHKPEDPAERSRIEAAGGFVSERGHCMRTQGILAMSRALGNRLLKPAVSAVPTVTSYALTADDQFFVLASDGLYDVFSNQRVVDIVQSAETPSSARARPRQSLRPSLRRAAPDRPPDRPPAPSPSAARRVQAARGEGLRGGQLRQHHGRRGRARRCGQRTLAPLSAVLAPLHYDCHRPPADSHPTPARRRPRAPGGRKFASLECGDQLTPEMATDAGRRALAEMRAAGSGSARGGAGGAGEGGAHGAAVGGGGGAGGEERKGGWFFGLLWGGNVLAQRLGLAAPAGWRVGVSVAEAAPVGLCRRMSMST